MAEQAPDGHWKARLKSASCRAVKWGEKIPPGIRSVLGLLLIAGGALGFLPVLGFWMLPLGVVLVCLDLPPLRRRLHNWLMASERPASPRSDRPHHLP